MALKEFLPMTQAAQNYYKKKLALNRNTSLTSGNNVKKQRGGQSSYKMHK